VISWKKRNPLTLSLYSSPFWVKHGGFISSCLSFIGIALATWVVLRFVTPVVVIVGRSMEPTYQNDDIVICNALDKSYQQGDTIVFKGHGIWENGNLIKRVAAVGGDVVDMDSTTGVISVNGEVFVDETRASLPSSKTLSFPLTVPDGFLFVLGDNAAHSTDSRCASLGLIATKDVIGVAKIRIPSSFLLKGEE